MKLLKMLAVLLIIFGISSLYYGSFSYVTSYQSVEIDLLECSTKMTERFNVPVWLGWTLIVSGCFLLLFTRRN